jgi:hypothetical protein
MAWTSISVIKKDPQHIFVRGDGRVLTCFQLDGVSAAGASGDLTLSTELTTTYGAGVSEQLMQTVRGSSLHWVYYVPGVAPNVPTTQGTIEVNNEFNMVLFTGTVATVGVAEGFNGLLTVPAANYAGVTAPPLTDAIIALGTLAATKTASYYFWFIK